MKNSKRNSVARAKNIVLPILSGILLTLSFSPFPFFFNAYFALIPLLLSIEKSDTKFRSFCKIYLAFLTLCIGSNWWIASWQKETDPFLMTGGIALAFVHPLFFVVPIIGYMQIKRRLGVKMALVALPFIWTAFEWLHSLGELSYPWLDLGYTQLSSVYFSQMADIGGVYIVGFAVVALNSLIYSILINYRALFASLRRTPLELIWQSSKKQILTVCAILLAVNLYGALRVRAIENKPGDKLKVGIIQANINPWDKWQSSPLWELEEYSKLSDSLAHAVGNYDLAVWSETSILYFGVDFNANHNYSLIKEKVNLKKYSLLSGIIDMKIYNRDNSPIGARSFKDSPEQKYEMYNSAIAIDSTFTADKIELHHKSRLTPFGENVPLSKTFSFLEKYFEWGVGVSSWAKGEEYAPLDMRLGGKNYKCGSVICIESIYPEFVRQYAKNGADFLAVITNDAWYNGTWGPRQHYDIARMRAIENRKWIARCGNSGISGTIDDCGRSIQELPAEEKLGMIANIYAKTGVTFYAEYGEWASIISFIIAIIFLIKSFFKTKKNDNLES